MQLAPHRFIFWHAAGALLLTAGIAWIPSLALAGLRADDSLSRIWLPLSDSGAKWGIGFVLLLATALVATRHTGLKARASKGLLFFVSLSVIIGGLAFINEFGIKRLGKFHRPYVKLLEQKGLLPSADEYYALPSRAQRTKFLETALEKSRDRPFVKSLPPAIREHWGMMTGYSFPSGHSLVAFLFAMILAFLIENLIPKGRWLVWIPFLWASGICLSRVAVGAHSPLDVTVGALAGGSAGGLILGLGWLDRMLPMGSRITESSPENSDENHAH